MVRNMPSSDIFGSKQRSPVPMRRRDEINATEDAATTELVKADGAEVRDTLTVRTGSSSPRSESTSPRFRDQGTTGPAEVSVEKKNEFFEIKGNMSMGVDPDIAYEILTDYENNPDIFKTVSKVEVEHRDNSKFVTQHAHWHLMFWSGTFEMRMKVEEDPSERAVSMKLTDPGFLKIFNGYWSIEPRVVDGKSMGCNVVVTQEVLPSMTPPGPLASVVSRILGNQVKAVLQDLCAEAERGQQMRRVSAE
ncbi:uncharacterized protein [Physcomitrium patens]|uniref:Coenzyme Q-binding protein COQ10 START domain-containing protein n=1 Tax=Physcomitrium patens TaxID=3218 RepID=A9REY8_PHYPA|nr:uncharacterized protein LOC112290325 [Physcomitrium patens]PNR42408.1 hypothetical protein PHYPA_017237 [Physcomitrium patens]|eukprot:XP_024392249.1 uncharacterized protein LOC112290325 [Physcomitrella patens]